MPLSNYSRTLQPAPYARSRALLLLTHIFPCSSLPVHVLVQAAVLFFAYSSRMCSVFFPTASPHRARSDQSHPFKLRRFLVSERESRKFFSHDDEYKTPSFLFKKRVLVRSETPESLKITRKWNEIFHA